MATVACPNCNKRFELPEPVKGSRVRSNPAEVMRRLMAFERDGTKRSEKELARLVGRGQAYVSNLLNIKQRVDEHVVAEWLSSWDRNGARVPVGAMIVFGKAAEKERIPRRQHKVEYARLLAKARLTKDQHKEKHTLSRRR